MSALWTSAAVAALANVVGAGQIREADIRRELTPIYRQLTTFSSPADELKWYREHTAPELLIKNPDGKHYNRRQLFALTEQAGCRDDLQPGAMISHTHDISRVTPTAQGALVASTDVAIVAERDRVGKWGPKELEHEVTYRLVNRDVWVKRGGRWLLQRNETLQETAVVDGTLREINFKPNRSSRR